MQVPLQRLEGGVRAGAAAASGPGASGTMQKLRPDGGAPGAPDANDNTLVQATLAGDTRAFEGLVRRYEERAWWAAYHLLGDAEEARDVVQDGFLRAYKALARFDFGMSFYTWLYRIVVNLAIDAMRKRARLKPVQLDDVAGALADDAAAEGPAGHIESAETIARVRAVLAKLPEKYRTVMTLRELDGLSCKEIATIVKSTHATVRWRLHIARRQFKEHWERMERAARHEAPPPSRSDEDAPHP
ncbi:MAG: sigma-70 family RNA polymerase sigma factor [Planctomycetes bacterium]|nr:sigma-70 family RNA polymerase sigma factor [Planctomycetota bacterium]